MMAVGQMLALLSTVDDAGTSPIATALAAPWAPAGDVTFFRASANFLFVFQRDGQPCVLRFVDAERRTEAALRAEIALVRHLDAAGIPVAVPLPSVAGADVVPMPTALGTFYATAFERIAGIHLDLDDLTPAQLRLWGSTLAQIHRAAAGRALPDRPAWHEQLALVEQHIASAESGARRALAAVRAQLAQLPVDMQSFGLIHGDFELDNLLWDGQRFVAIDFDECARSWFVADIAGALRDLFGDRASRIDLEHPALQQFVAGYRAEWPLSEAALERLPLFMVVQHLINFASIVRALGESPQSGAPDWAATLHQKLEHKLDGYRAEFETFAV